MAESVSGTLHGVVLAGAYRSHSALDRLVPRPLLPVAQQPLVTYALRWMRDGGIQDVTICANSSVRAIQASLNGSRHGLRVGFLEDFTPRGAAGCVRDAGIRTDASTFVVADGTALPGVDIQSLLESHRSSGAALTVVVSAGAAARLQPTGVYVFDRRALYHIPEDSFQDIKERLIPKLHDAGEHVATHMAHSVAPRVVSTDTYLALNQWAVERASLLLDPSDGFRASGEAVVHGSASVDPTARLLGPVLLGPHVTVQAGATLVGSVTIGRGTTIGRRAVVSRSVVWSDCHLGDGSFVDRSMLADGVAIEARTQAFSVVRLGPLHGGGRRRGPNGLASATWDPVIAALRPATPDGP